MGAIHTKYRSRLVADRVRNMVMVKDDINRCYPTTLGSLDHARAHTEEDSDTEDADSNPEQPVPSDCSPAHNGTSHSAAAAPQHSFSSVVARAVNAATRDAAENARNDDLDADVTPVHLQEGLMLRNLFDYGSPTFIQITNMLWTTGQRAIDAEVVYHEEHPTSSLVSSETNPESPSTTATA